MTEPGHPPGRVLQVLRESGAVRSGHFLLTSGRHSDTYVEKFRLLERPELAGPLLGELAARFPDHRVSVGLGPARGGLFA
ncbi:MAG: orotate phosphoribosyltransferase, partial [Bacillota bacterium]